MKDNLITWSYRRFFLFPPLLRLLWLRRHIPLQMSLFWYVLVLLHPSHIRLMFDRCIILPYNIILMLIMAYYWNLIFNAPSNYSIKCTFRPFCTTLFVQSWSHLHILLHSYIGVPSSTLNLPNWVYDILWPLNAGQHVFSVPIPHLPSRHSHPIGGSSGIIIPWQGWNVVFELKGRSISFYLTPPLYFVWSVQFIYLVYIYIIHVPRRSL